MSANETNGKRVEPSYIIHSIGPKIRTLRKAKGILISELAELSGLSTPMVSKIENGRAVPTLPSLLSILNALQIEPETFFAEINGESTFQGYIHLKPEDYTHYVKEESAIGFIYKSILEKAIDGQAFQISHITLKPNNTRPQVRTDAFEFLYILEGEIEYYLEEVHFTLKAGESLFFDGNIPHVPLNKTDKNASYIVLYMFNKEK